MALLILDNKEEIRDLNVIRERISPLGVELSHWPIDRSARTSELLAQKGLNTEEKDELLKALDSRFEEQKRNYGYQTRDLIVLNDQIPDLDKLLAKFDKTHTHDDDEVRYIVDGSGFFGFIFPGGEQALLKVEAEEYIRVPAKAEHWFILDESKRIKAVRYFTSQDGWVANYTGTEIQIG